MRDINAAADRDAVVAVIGRDLNGYVLEDVAIDYLEQTPKHLLDPSNILDAEGIRATLLARWPGLAAAAPRVQAG